MNRNSRKRRIFMIYVRYGLFVFKEILQIIFKFLVSLKGLVIYLLVVCCTVVIVDLIFKIGFVLSVPASILILLLGIVVKCKVEQVIEKRYQNRLSRVVYCPYCSSKLRTGLSRQCFHYGESWYK